MAAAGFVSMEKWMVPGPSTVEEMTPYEKMCAKRREENRIRQKNKQSQRGAPLAGYTKSSSFAKQASASYSRQIAQQKVDGADKDREKRKDVMLANGHQVSSAAVGSTIYTQQIHGPQADGENGRAAKIARVMSESTAVATATVIRSAAAAAAAAARPLPTTTSLNKSDDFALSTLFEELMEQSERKAGASRKITVLEITEVPMPLLMSVTLNIIRACIPLVVELEFRSSSLRALRPIEFAPFNQYGFYITWQGTYETLQQGQGNAMMRKVATNATHKSNFKKSKAIGPSDSNYLYQPHVVLLGRTRFRNIVLPEKLVVRFVGTKQMVGCMTEILLDMGYVPDATQITMERADALAHAGPDTFYFTSYWKWTGSTITLAQSDSTSGAASAAAAASATTPVTAAPSADRPLPLEIDMDLDTRTPKLAADDDFADEFPF